MNSFFNFGALPRFNLGELWRSLKPSDENQGSTKPQALAKLSDTNLIQILSGAALEKCAASEVAPPHELKPGESSPPTDPTFASPDSNSLQNCLKNLGIKVDGNNPSQNSPNLPTSIDWAAEISKNTLAGLQRTVARQSQSEVLSQDAEIYRLTQLLILALASGNIGLAMMIFSHLEAKAANEVTKALMEKVRSLQEHKRDLSLQIQKQGNDAQGSKNIEQIKNQMEDANDDINVLETFIHDVAQNKQNSMELANAFLNNEHDTTMAIVRSFNH